MHPPTIYTYFIFPKRIFGMTRLLPLKQFIFFGFIFINSPSFASNGLGDIQGLILDRTITLSGHTFYQRFSAHWLAKNLTQPFNLTIIEKPSARWGNLIIISSQNQVLYRTSIRPGKQLKQNIIKQAASTVSQNIFNRLIVKSTSQDMAQTGY
jgi:curli production assembly/transport component CsgE